MSSQDDWIRISSRDGFSFVVKRNVALHSGTLRSMLDERHSFAEAVQKVCPIDERAAVTEKFVEYLAFKATYENAPPNEELPDFSERVAPEIALELLSAADYLETRGVLYAFIRIRSLDWKYHLFKCCKNVTVFDYVTSVYKLHAWTEYDEHTKRAGRSDLNVAAPTPGSNEEAS